MMRKSILKDTSQTKCEKERHISWAPESELVRVRVFNARIDTVDTDENKILENVADELAIVAPRGNQIAQHSQAEAVADDEEVPLMLRRHQEVILRTSERLASVRISNRYVDEVDPESSDSEDDELKRIGESIFNGAVERDYENLWKSHLAWMGCLLGGLASLNLIRSTSGFAFFTNNTNILGLGGIAMLAAMRSVSSYVEAIGNAVTGEVYGENATESSTPHSDAEEQAEAGYDPASSYTMFRGSGL